MSVPKSVSGAVGKVYMDVTVCCHRNRGEFRNFMFTSLPVHPPDEDIDDLGELEETETALIDELLRTHSIERGSSVGLNGNGYGRASSGLGIFGNKGRGEGRSSPGTSEVGYRSGGSDEGSHHGCSPSSSLSNVSRASMQREGESSTLYVNTGSAPKRMGSSGRKGSPNVETPQKAALKRAISGRSLHSSIGNRTVEYGEQPRAPVDRIMSRRLSLFCANHES